MNHARRRLNSLVGFALLVVAREAAGQAPVDVVRGRITTEASVPVVGATIIVTAAPTMETFQTASDSSGNYTIRIRSASGEYILYVGAIGREPSRRRLVRSGRDSTFVVDIALRAAVPVIEAVQVRVSAPRPERSIINQLSRITNVGTDASDKSVDGVTGAVSPELLGDLDAQLALIPGLTVTPDGVSAFGLGAESSSRTLNGLSSSVTELPRGTLTNTRVVGSPWDPTLGSGSGPLIATTIASGDNIRRRRSAITIDAPGLQFGESGSARPGQEFTNVVLSAAGEGPISYDNLYYASAGQLSRRTTDIVSLIDLNDDMSRRTGVPSDSVRRLLSLLSAQGVPVGMETAHRQQATSARITQRIDHPGRAAANGAAPSAAWWLSGIGNYTLFEAVGGRPTAMPSITGSRRNVAATIQGAISSYFGRNDAYLNETTASFSIADQRSSPYVDMPTGTVVVRTDGEDGGRASRLDFGGNDALTSATTTWTTELGNQTSFLVAGKPRLPLKLALNSRLSGFRRNGGINKLGVFEFASLEDLAAGQPRAFSRTLQAGGQSGGEWIGSAAIGGTWNTGTIYWTGGGRLDGNVFTTSPRRNMSVEALANTRSDHVPNTLAFSPRFGFNWYYRGSPATTILFNPGSTLSFGDAQIRGGIGEFRDVLPATLLSSGSGAGRSYEPRTVSCVGAVVPRPDWAKYADDQSAVPDSCLDGTPALTDTARTFTLFAPDYLPTLSRRASLGWTGRIWRSRTSIEATYSINMHRPGSIDLNFGGVPRFSLSDEDDRPVFVSPASIVPLTGALSPVDGRRTPALGRVLERVSDLRSDSKQLSIYSIVFVPARFGRVVVGYTLSDARASSRGFDGSTSGDPREAERASLSAIPTHQFRLQYSRVAGPVVVSGVVRLNSGTRYTPMVGSDINGDGMANDRAFVFDPIRLEDAELATEMRALLARTDGNARRCLESQIGRIAAPNSCMSPWSLGASAFLQLYRLPVVGERAKVSMAFANPLAGLDALVNGAGALRGWGSSPIPNATLLDVRGFNQATHRFLYQVNQGFGTTRSSSRGTYDPFRVTLDVSVDLGRSRQEQLLEHNLRLRLPLVGSRAPVDSIKKRYMNRVGTEGFVDVHDMIMRMSDSLAISRAQAETLRGRQKVLQTKVEAIYEDLGKYLARLPSKYDAADALKHVTDATSAMWEVIYAERDFLSAVLTPGQVQLLPRGLFLMLTDPTYRGRFY